MDDTTTSAEISAANSCQDIDNSMNCKGEGPIHLESLNRTPSIHLEDEKDAGQTSPPCDDPKDPRNWPEWKQNTQILMVSFHSLCSTFMAAGIVPASHTFSHLYGVSLPQASYLVSAQILLLGVSPLILWNALTARYGRYHILLFSVVGSMACNIGGARCVSFAGQMTTRVLTAFIISPPIGIGSGVVAELCPPEKRGQKLGWWVLMTVLGTPLGPFIMGFVVQHAGVQWIFWIFVIINFLQAVAYLLFGEETLYIRDSKNPCETSSHSRLRSLLPRRINPAPFQTRDAFAPILLVRHSRILVPAIATGITFCYGNIAFVVEMPISFGEKFNFSAQQIGLQFLSIIIGAVIGEQLSGPMSDAFLKARARSRNGLPRPADRLWLAYIGFATLFAGILTWGFQLQKAETWNVTPCVGVAIASFGNQVQSTILTAYAVDSHKDQSAAIGVFVNFVRLIYGFIGPFYFPNMFALGYGTAAGVMCAVSAVGGLVPTIAIHIATSR